MSYTGVGNPRSILIEYLYLLSPHVFEAMMPEPRLYTAANDWIRYKPDPSLCDHMLATTI